MKKLFTLFLILLFGGVQVFAQGDCTLQANAGPDKNVLCGVQFSLEGSANEAEGVSYLWSPPMGLSNPNIPNPTTSLTSTRTYTLRVVKNGCVSLDTVTIGVLPQKAALTGLPDKACTNSGPITLSGIPGGGGFSGTGIDGNTFNPSSVNPGTYIIQYFVNVAGCEFLAKDTIIVQAAPVADFQDFPSQTCSSSQALPLNGTPPGGTFSGPGVSGNFFDPQISGAGTFTIKYTGTVDGCNYTTQDEITVASAPQAAFGQNTPTNLCVDSAPILLSASPDGGVFSGPGISGNVFSPSAAGVGEHSLLYTGTDNNGCTFSVTHSISIQQAIGATITGLNNLYCVNSANVSLSGTPSGGVFSGPGVSDGVFSPEQAGAGNHFISYSGNADACSYITSMQVTVSAPPDALIFGLNAPYCVNSPASALTGFPSGGTFSGNGISDTSFDPALAGVGLHTISYFGIESGCTYSFTAEVLVNDAPIPQFIGLNNAYCQASGVVALVASPAGGIFGGPGVSGNIFDPAVAGAGTHEITYTGNIDGCTYGTTQMVSVGALTTLAIAGISNNYIATDPPVSYTGFPDGGTFSGPGMNGNVFTPADAGNGVHTIVYEGLSDGCYYRIQQAVTVRSVCNLTSNLTKTDVTGVGANNGTISANYSSLPAGTYTVSIVGPDGCFYQEQITINDADCNGLAANAGFDVTTCLGVNIQLPGSATGGVGGYTYKWMPATGLSNPNIANPIATPAFTTNYTLTVTDVSGCTAQDIITVNILAGPAIQAIGSDATCFQCSNGKIDVVAIGGNPPYTYSLNNATPVSAPTFTGLAAGTYTVAVIDLNGCRSTETVEISQPIPACTVPANVTAFNATSTTVTVAWAPVGAATAYIVSYRVANTANFTEFTTTQTSIQISSLVPSTNYEVRVKALCVADQSSAFSSLVPFSTLSVGATCPVPGNISVVGSINSGVISWTAVPGATRYNILYRKNEPGAVWSSLQAPGTATSFTITGLQPGVEYVFIMNTRCTSGTSAWSPQMSFIPVAGRFSANADEEQDNERRADEEQFSVYPNPMMETCSVRLRTNFDGQGQLVITNLNGQKLRSQIVRIREGNNEFELIVDDLPVGIYLLKLNYDDRVKATKIIIRK